MLTGMCQPLPDLPVICICPRWHLYLSGPFAKLLQKLNVPIAAADTLARPILKLVAAQPLGGAVCCPTDLLRSLLNPSHNLNVSPPGARVTGCTPCVGCLA